MQPSAKTSVDGRFQPRHTHRPDWWITPEAITLVRLPLRRRSSHAACGERATPPRRSDRARGIARAWRRSQCRRRGVRRLPHTRLRKPGSSVSRPPTGALLPTQPVASAERRVAAACGPIRMCERRRLGRAALPDRVGAERPGGRREDRRRTTRRCVSRAVNCEQLMHQLAAVVDPSRPRDIETRRRAVSDKSAFRQQWE